MFNNGIPSFWQDLEKFLSDAEHGAIYVSFGSILELEMMSKYKLQQFLDAFNRIPYKIIWKMNITLPAGSDKFYVSSWMPQLDILCKISQRFCFNW